MCMCVCVYPHTYIYTSTIIFSEGGAMAKEKSVESSPLEDFIS